MTLCVLSNLSLWPVPYWVDQFVRREPNTHQMTELLRPLMAKASDVARQALYDGIEAALQFQPPREKPAADHSMRRPRCARRQRAPGPLLEFNDGAARRALPFEAAMWDLEVARAELDQDRARAALAAAALAKPAYTNSQE